MSNLHTLRPPLPLYALSLMVALPALLAYNLSPSSTLLNQLLAVAVWGLVLLIAPGSQAQGRAEDAARPATAGLRPAHWPALSAAVMLIMVGLAWSLSNGLPDSIARSSLAILLVALALALWAQEREMDAAMLGRGLLLAGGLSAVIAVIQVFLPSWADGTVIARSGLVGRAVGNLRQPNHLSTVLLWGLIWWVPLAQRSARQPGQARALAWSALAALLVLGVVLTASRTGTVGIVLLALWGLVDRRLLPRVRWSLVAAPLVYLLFWALMAAWAHHTQHTFGGEVRLAEGDLSASRFGIWSNTLAMIRAQPWTGVGWGEFNFAWTLTPFPGRPVAFFDHSHNLPLNLLVELGLPLGGLVLLLLLFALGQAGWCAWSRQGEDGATARAAFMTVLLIGLHSLLEYPLWYAYFLLPTAWAWGHALRPPLTADGRAGRGTAGAGAPEPSSSAIAAAPDAVRPKPKALGAAAAWTWPVIGSLMLAGAALAAWDYGKVVVIYTPSDDAAPLPQRIARGQQSWFFAHLADYAAATSTEPPSQAMAAFNSTTHSLLDTRLMMDWARALAESGHTDKARHLAARLREFRNPAADEFFAPCEAEPRPSPLPFQCEPPAVALSWRDFLPQ